MNRHILIADRFFAEAPQLRHFFANKYADPRAARGDRFVWDYWHVPGQYTHLRTPAAAYFPRQIFHRLQAALLKFGRENLGCAEISPPWLSLYVDGCEQRLHSDVPHGPWAFVFSLTEWNRRQFTGGETIMLRPQTLNYWQSFSQQEEHEYDAFVESVPAKFNRLTVFDPRLPHGVSRVRGSQDPLHGRLVVHGWFTEPRPFVVGALSPRRCQGVLHQFVHKLGASVATLSPVHGTICLRWSIAPNGHIRRHHVVSNSLLSLDGGGLAPFYQLLARLQKETRLPQAKGPSTITLPLLFR